MSSSRVCIQGYMGTPLLLFGIAGDQSVQNCLTLPVGWSITPHESTVTENQKIELEKLFCRKLIWKKIRCRETDCHALLGNNAL